MTLTDFITTATGLVALFIPLAFIIFAFSWNLFRLIAASGNAEKTKQARPRLIWGIIAFAIFFSLMGIIAMLRLTFFNDSYPTPFDVSGWRFLLDR